MKQLNETPTLNFALKISPKEPNEALIKPFFSRISEMNPKQPNEALNEPVSEAYETPSFFPGQSPRLLDLPV